MSDSSYEGYEIAAAVEYGLSILPLVVLSLVSLLAVRRRNDPLRLPFLWLKLAIPLQIISATLNTAAEVLVVVINFLDYFDPPFALYQASWRTSSLSSFFANLADNFILLCLVELALSFLRAFGKDGIYHKIIRYSNFVALAILFALAIAAEGTNEDYTTQSDYGANFDVSPTTVDNLFGAYYIIYWIISLPVVILSSIVLYISIRRKHLQGLAGCFLAASLVNLIRTTWDLAYAILYEINYNPYTSMPLYIIVINPILYYWATVVLLILLVVIGFKKSNGLWSQERYYSGSRPQQQQFYGGGQVQGQGVPISQLTGAGSNKPSLQPAQAEIIGGASPTWRAELTGVNYTNPTQQYYGTQYQQQLPVMQNEVTQAYGSGTQNEMA